MAGRADIEAGRASVRLYVKNNELLSGLKSVAGTIAVWSTGIMNVMSLTGTVVTGLRKALFGASEMFAEVGSAVQEMAQRTGLTTEAVSELGFAAKMSGASAEDLEGGIRKMQKTIAEAQAGSKSATDTLDALGVSMDMLAEPPDAQLEMFADRIAGIHDPAQRTAAALDIFGKSGTKLLPLLSEGAKGIRAAREAAAAAGQSMSAADAANADALGDAWDEAKASLSSIALTIGGAVAPSFINLLEIAKNVIGSISQWVRENKSLLASFEGITATLSGGDWASAGEIALAHLKVSFLDGIATISTLIGSLSETFGDVLGTIGTQIAGGGFAGAWDTAVLGMAAVWDTFTQSIVNAFTAAANVVTDVWQKATTAISDFILSNQKTVKNFIDFAVASTPGGQLAEHFAGGKASDFLLGPDIAPGDVGKAKQIAGQQLASQADAVRKQLDAANAAAAAKATQSAGAFGDRIKGGASKSFDALADAKAELDRLNAEAAKKAAGRAKGLEGPGVPDVAGLKNAASAATFSGSALIAFGQGGGPQERIAKDMAESRKHLKEAVELLKKGNDLAKTVPAFG